MIKLTAPPRGIDTYGSGAYLAARGARRHNGIDFKAAEGSIVHPMSRGEVTKLGWCYNDDPSYRYVQVTDMAGYRVRYFYVSPSVKLGDKVDTDTKLGTVQDLTTRYKTITPHVHLEVKDLQGQFMDPAKYASII